MTTTTKTQEAAIRKEVGMLKRAGYDVSPAMLNDGTCQIIANLYDYTPDGDIVMHETLIVTVARNGRTDWTV